MGVPAVRVKSFLSIVAQPESPTISSRCPLKRQLGRIG